MKITAKALADWNLNEWTFVRNHDIKVGTTESIWKNKLTGEVSCISNKYEIKGKTVSVLID